MFEGSRKVSIGYKVAKMETELMCLIEENKKLKIKSGKLRSSDSISLKVINMNLGLHNQKDKDIAVAKKSSRGKDKRFHVKIEA